MAIRIPRASSRSGMAWSTWPETRASPRTSSQEDEAAWVPLRLDAGTPEALKLIVDHTTCCKVVYANYAFGDASVDWQDPNRIIGSSWESLGPGNWGKPLALAHEYLVDKVRAAPERLALTRAMHHGVPLTGLEVVATMVEHDAWHAGQVSVIREAYSALVEPCG